MSAATTGVLEQQGNILGVFSKYRIQHIMGTEKVLYLSVLKVTEELGIEQPSSKDPKELSSAAWSYTKYFEPLVERGLIELKQYKLSKNFLGQRFSGFNDATDMKFLTEDEKKLVDQVAADPSMKDVVLPLYKLTKKGIKACISTFAIE